MQPVSKALQSLTSWFPVPTMLLYGLSSSMKSGLCQAGIEKRSSRRCCTRQLRASHEGSRPALQNPSACFLNGDSTAFNIELNLSETSRIGRAFSCGVEVLDRYLQKQAGQDASKHVAALFVITPDAESPKTKGHANSIYGMISFLFRRSRTALFTPSRVCSVQNEIPKAISIVRIEPFGCPPMARLDPEGDPGLAHRWAATLHPPVSPTADIISAPKAGKQALNPCDHPCNVRGTEELESRSQKSGSSQRGFYRY
jgi:hypothetical protein